MPNIFIAMPGSSNKACDACVWGRGTHADWCEDRPSRCLDRIDKLLAEDEHEPGPIERLVRNRMERAFRGEHIGPTSGITYGNLGAKITSRSGHGGKP